MGAADLYAVVGAVYGGEIVTDWKAWFRQSVEKSGDSPAASHYDSLRSFRVRQRAVLDWLGDLRGMTILDVGPGAGHFSQPLTAHNTVIGIDFVPQMLKYAANKGLLPVQGDGLELPFPSAAFDVVICVGVLQHIDQSSSFIKELLRVRKPKGQLFLDTLNSESWVRWLYYKLTPFEEIMHTYQMEVLIQRFKLFAPDSEVSAAEIYYPLPGYRRIGDQPGISRHLATSFIIRVH